VVDAGASQHITIAKLRAVRLIHARFVEAFGLPPLKANVHAETSWRMMTRQGVHTNILRTTSAAFAAGISGADSITVLPFTVAVGLPDAFARRVARNSQIILIEEAGLARVGDPTAGSGAIESLTNALAETAWEKFRTIEASGGLLGALRSGTFQTDIAQMRTARAAKIALRSRKITGVSEYPTLDDIKVTVASPRRTTTTAPAPASEAIESLVSVRLAEPFEALRDRAAALVAAGKPPSVFLASFGTSSKLAEVEQAAATFFAAGGIRAAAAADFEGAEAAARSFAASGARAACLVSGGEAMHGLAISAAPMLKATGARRVYFASDQDLGDTITLPGIDAIVGDGVDAVALLDDLLGTLEAP
jgi:methylmalonyl-CoA mutase